VCVALDARTPPAAWVNDGTREHVGLDSKRLRLLPVETGIACRTRLGCGATGANHLVSLNTIQEIQVVAPPKRQVYTGAPCGGQKDLSLNMHSQQSMNYTHRAARGDVAASAAIPAGVSISATAAQWRTRQHTAADRVRAHRGRSFIGEVTLHRVRVGPRRHANTKMALGRRPSPHSTAAADGMGSVGAVGQRGLRRHAAAIDAGRRASITRPIVSVRWRHAGKVSGHAIGHATSTTSSVADCMTRNLQVSCTACVCPLTVEDPDH